MIVHRVFFWQFNTYLVVAVGDTNSVSIKFFEPPHPSEAVQLSAFDTFQLRVLLCQELILVPPLVVPNIIVGVCGVTTVIF